MQVRLERGRAASGVRSVSRFAFFAGVPLIAALALSAPERAFAACGPSHPAGVHSGTGTGSHTATSRPSSGGSGGGGGTLGCANGASATALHGLSIAGSGKVVEMGVHAPHTAARTTTHARTAATKPANATAHLRGAKPPHA
ncbi:MAG TPA: hypothetical protein VKR62_05130 [Roseiarcus sp.]|nr:hypothetical protein [Roseiarcus sp.]